MSEESPSEIGPDEGRMDRGTMKKMRLEYPSGWLKLAKSTARALMLDALLDLQQGHEFTHSDLAERAGLSSESVRQHIGTLVELGIVDKIRDTSPTTYRLNSQAHVTKELRELNSAVNAVKAGEEAEEATSPEEAADNAGNSDDDRDSNHPRPDDIKNLTNASPV